jgi:L-alanine-DL-glutamate epimerase-like enolase superfamily enzyme
VTRTHAGVVPLSSDVRVTSVTASYRDIPFATPLHLSSGPITALTEARVTVGVTRRDGRGGTGLGSVLLSYPWAGGTDQGMRSAIDHFMNRVVSYDYADPMQHGTRLLDEVAALPKPRLAAEVALGPVDQAVHDAWASAEGRSAYEMYDGAYLDTDLSAYLGLDFAGRWPADWLAAQPADRLPVQYVLGVGESMSDASRHAWLKVKLTGKVDDDIARVREVAALGVQISLDPNEAYVVRADLVRLLSETDAVYVEQPMPRGDDGPGLGAVPVLADEGLPDPRQLDSLRGWDGIVVKTCRGQTAALLAYCWARQRDRFVVQQDLTHVGPALAHAATFAAHCEYSVRAFECNSLKFAPAGNTELSVDRPGLVNERDGFVEVSASGLGIR